MVEIDYLKELLIPIVIFCLWTIFSITYIIKFKRSQLRKNSNKRGFWNNTYIFDALPSVFPTLGIFCTALGITIGIWNFNTTDIQGSIPQLLQGLRLAFIATMAGIIGLIIFQKVTAIVQKHIDDDPNKPIKETDELTVLSKLNFSMERIKSENEEHFKGLLKFMENELENKIEKKLSLLIESFNYSSENQKKIITEISQLREDQNLSLKTINTESAEHFQGMLKFIESELENKIEKKLSLLIESFTYSSENQNKMVAEIGQLREDQNLSSEKANSNTEEIIKAMSGNNKLISKKFDEFSELLKRNNTEALVQVMKSATEQFNSQMSELIDRLVKENFKELNISVKNLNDWQIENKNQIQILIDNFLKTTEMFDITAKSLNEVAKNTKSLTDDNGKLAKIIGELGKVMIEDGKFQEMAEKINNTVEILSATTESFDETTSKLNDWIKTERNFKESAQIIITKLEEFRDFNGDVWDKYRKEMQKSVSIVSEVSTRLGSDLENINSEFYERLNDTLNNLDQCIQRFIPVNPKR